MSNFDISELEEIWLAGGEGRIACNQVLYHWQERAVEHAVLPWCKTHKVSVVAYSPFGSGDFPDPFSSGGAVLTEVAERHGATVRQVSLSFIVRDPAVFAIPKASSEEHAAENAGAGDLTLSDADVQAISSAFPRQKPPRHLPMI